jgi:hypothetical protein
MFYFLKMASKPNNESLTRQFIRLDPLGTLFFLPGMVSILLALQWGGVTYAWNNGRIIALFVVGGLAMIAFAAVQVWRKDDATIPLRIIKQRSVLAGTFYVSCIGGGLVTMLYYISIWFQAIKGVSPVKSGIDTIPMVLGLVFAAIFTGGTVRRTGMYVPWMFVSAVLMSVGAGLITTFHVDTNHAKWIGYQVIFGFGIGSGMQQPSIAAQTVLDRRDVAIGVSLMFFANSFGGAVFVCISQLVFENHLLKHLTGFSGINASEVASMGATQLRAVIPAEELGPVLVVYNAALTKAFIVTAAISTFMIVPALFMEWRKIPPMPTSIPEENLGAGKPEGSISEKGETEV